jgi:hypothetical protein
MGLIPLSASTAVELTSAGGFNEADLHVNRAQVAAGADHVCFAHSLEITGCQLSGRRFVCIHDTDLRGQLSLLSCNAIVLLYFLINLAMSRCLTRNGCSHWT